MTHSQTPPRVPELPVAEIKELIMSLPTISASMNEWLGAQGQLAHWQAEEKKRKDFIAAVRDAIFWDGEELDESAIRALYERTVAAAKSGEL